MRFFMWWNLFAAALNGLVGNTVLALLGLSMAFLCWVVSLGET